MSSDSLWQKHWKGESRGKNKPPTGWRVQLSTSEFDQLNRSIALYALASDPNSIKLQNKIERELIMLVCTMAKLLDGYDTK